ncbi:MAG: GrpB family protein [Aggregatilineales bacterium]
MLEIIPYQEHWPFEFQAIASILRQGLGELALRIDHIGSTAVPGLPAKDIIDVQITVAALGSHVVSAMTALGYIQPEGIWRDHRPPNAVDADTEWEKLFFRPPPSQRRTNTHVRVQGRANQRYALLFRDYLRLHPASAAAYAELKRRLVQYLADPETYPDVKDPAVDLIYVAAEDWSAATNWQLGTSDG